MFIKVHVVCPDICPRTLSVPKSEQFSESEARGKLFALMDYNFNYYELLFWSGHMVPFCLFPLRIYGTQQSMCHFPAVSIYNRRAITACKASESGAITLLINTTTRSVTIDNSDGIRIT